MTASAQAVRRLDRAAVQRFLPLLDEWLLDGAPYGVQHTWPLLYRSDGDGAFFGILDEGQLLSHCAYRTATLCDGEEQRRVALIGSVATAPRAQTPMGPMRCCWRWGSSTALTAQAGKRCTHDSAPRRPRRSGRMHGYGRELLSFIGL